MKKTVKKDVKRHAVGPKIQPAAGNESSTMHIYGVPRTYTRGVWGLHEKYGEKGGEEARGRPEDPARRREREEHEAHRYEEENRRSANAPKGERAEQRLSIVCTNNRPLWEISHIIPTQFAKSQRGTDNPSRGNGLRQS